MTVEELIDILRQMPEGDEVRLFYNGQARAVVGAALSEISKEGFSETFIMTEKSYKDLLLKKQLEEL